MPITSAHEMPGPRLKEMWNSLPTANQIEVMRRCLETGYENKCSSTVLWLRNAGVMRLESGGFLHGIRPVNLKQTNWIKQKRDKLFRALFRDGYELAFSEFRRYFIEISPGLNDAFLKERHRMLSDAPDTPAAEAREIMLRALQENGYPTKALVDLYKVVLIMDEPRWEENTPLSEIELAATGQGESEECPASGENPSTEPTAPAVSPEAREALAPTPLPPNPTENGLTTFAEVCQALRTAAERTLNSSPEETNREFSDALTAVRELANRLNQDLAARAAKAGLTDISWDGPESWAEVDRQVNTSLAQRQKAAEEQEQKWFFALADWIEACRDNVRGRLRARDNNQKLLDKVAAELRGISGADAEKSFPGRSVAPGDWWAWWQERDDAGILIRLRDEWDMPCLAQALEEDILPGPPDGLPPVPGRDIRADAESHPPVGTGREDVVDTSPVSTSAAEEETPPWDEVQVPNSIEAVTEATPAAEEGEAAPHDEIRVSDSDEALTAVPPRIAEPEPLSPGEGAAIPNSCASNIGGIPPKPPAHAQMPASGASETTWPKRCESLDRFIGDHHFNPATLQIELAPWAEAGQQEFRQRVLNDLDAALKPMENEIMDFNRVQIDFAALREMGEKDIPHADDLSIAATLLTNPNAFQQGLDEARVERLLALGASPSERHLGLCLEALRPSEALAGLPEESFTQLTSKTVYETPGLDKLIKTMLRLGRHRRTPEALFRDLSRKPATTPEQARAEFEDKRSKLHQWFTTHYNAGGGKIERTHCRNAWTEFMDWVHPSLSPMFPGAQYTDATGGEFRRVLDKMEDQFARIADRHNALYKDRHRMDRLFKDLKELALQVNQAFRALKQAEKSIDESSPADVESIRQGLGALMSSTNVTAHERLEWRLIRLLASDNQTDISTSGGNLGCADFLQHPGWLEALPNGQALSVGDDSAFTLASLLSANDNDFARARRLLTIMRHPQGHTGLDMKNLEEHLHRTGQTFLLSRLANPTDAGKESLSEWRNRQMQSLAQLAEEMRRYAGQLEELASPHDAWARGIAGEAERLMEDGTDLRRLFYAPVWLSSVRESMKLAIGVGVDHLRTRLIGASEDIRKMVESAIASKQYATAMKIMDHGESPEAGEDHAAAPMRETPWRDEAATLFAEPWQRLQALSQPAQADRASPAQRNLVAAWLRHPEAAAAAPQARGDGKTLQTYFLEWIFSKTLNKDDVLARHSRYRCDTVRQALHPFNPTFLPQLTAFREWAVISSDIPVHRQDFRNDIIRRLQGMGGDDAIRWVVVLAPQCTWDVRHNLLNSLRRHQNTVVGVIDDIDLCRLLNPDCVQPNLPIGLTEILLEQRRDRQDRLSPYRGGDGRTVTPEMYVGRQALGDALAGNNDYTRLFSGRKLGKSALLKNTQDRHDGATLPSGNVLHVVYVMGNATHDEFDAVQRIIDAIKNKLKGMSKFHIDLEAPLRRGQDDPGVFLKEAMHRLLQDNPTLSLLIVMDEADVFVTEQVEAYPQRKEAGLSFRMGREIVAQLDTNNLPRIRFLFAGYRVTDTAEGVWRNWGRVLELKPLEPMEARQLLVGPFARLGVDIAEHADQVAWRCGYQPAVIMKFGDRLLRQLNDTRAEHVRPGQDEINEILSSREVTEEIVTITEGNFQGNEPLGVVFEAFLLEAGLLPTAAHWLDAAADAVAGRIAKMESESPAAVHFDRERVSRLLDELHRRSLLEKERGRFRLRFPHHFHILLPSPDEGQLRRALDKVAGFTGHSPYWRGIATISNTLLDEVQFFRAESGGLPVILGSSWPALFSEPCVGAADRLGTEYRSYTAEEAIHEFSRPRTQSQSSAPVWFGGVELLRLGLERGDQCVVFGFRRLSPEQVIWWFCQVRLWGLGVDVARAIHQRTGGIPELLCRMEELFKQKVSARSDHGDPSVECDLSGSTNDLFGCFEQELRQWRDTLLSVDASPLTLRERELLALAVRRGKELGDTTKSAEVIEWLAMPDDGDHDVRAFDRQNRDDWNALRLLVESGLLPSHSHGLPLYDTVLLPGSNDPLAGGQHEQ